MSASQPSSPGGGASASQPGAQDRGAPTSESPPATEIDLGRFGIRAWGFTDADETAAVEAAVELERLGFTTIWIRATAFFERAAALLRATDHLVVASSVISVWSQDAEQLAAAAENLWERFPARALIGIGISHRPIVDRDNPGRFIRPVATMRNYLDQLDQAGLSPRRRIIAALGPKMLEISGKRSLGTHPYLVTPEHTAEARRTVGPDGIVAPAHVVTLERDPTRARELAREHLDKYMSYPNYGNTWLRTGFSEADLAAGGSDRLLDTLVAWGDPDAVVRKLGDHFDAGASHVALHTLSADNSSLPLQLWRELATALNLTP